jgi:hypothetical protein
MEVMMTTLQRRRKDALTQFCKITTRRRELLGRFLDIATWQLNQAVLDGPHTGVELEPKYVGMTTDESKEVHETLKDIRQFCEIKGEIQ